MMPGSHNGRSLPEPSRSSLFLSRISIRCAIMERDTAPVVGFITRMRASDETSCITPLPRYATTVPASWGKTHDREGSHHPEPGAVEGFKTRSPYVVDRHQQAGGQGQFMQRDDLLGRAAGPVIPARVETPRGLEWIQTTPSPRHVRERRSGIHSTVSCNTKGGRLRSPQGQ